MAFEIENDITFEQGNNDPYNVADTKKLWKYFETIIDNKICLEKYIGTDTSVSIPERIGDKKVAEIGEEAFYNCDSITDIKIPDGITHIGNEAFSCCSSLTSINIPDSVTSIGEAAFRNCSSLTSITIPDGVTEIGDSAFAECSSLTTVNIPDSVTEISEQAFANCSNLSQINIPKNVKKSVVQPLQVANN